MLRSGPLSPLRQLVPANLREHLRAAWNRVRASFLPEPYRTCMPYTMASLERLQTLDRLARQIDERGVPGDVVECGTCNGGSAAILARVACRSPLNRHIWLLDSFAGLPPAGDRDGPAAAAYTGLCRGSLETVRTVLGKVEVPEHAVTALPGWFQDTLPTLPASPIALLHIDADWYESVRICLDQIFDRVAPGGFIVLDDYGYWQGCREAWHDFEKRRQLSLPLIDVDGIGVYLQKPATPSDSPTESVLAESGASLC